MRNHAAGTVFLCGQGMGSRVVAIPGLDAVVEELGDLLVELKRPKIGQQCAAGYEGEGYAIVSVPTREEVMRSLLLRCIPIEGR